MSGKKHNKQEELRAKSGRRGRVGSKMHLEDVSLGLKAGSSEVLMETTTAIKSPRDAASG